MITCNAGIPQTDDFVLNVLLWGIAVVGAALGGACTYIVKLHKENRQDRKADAQERKEMHEAALGVVDQVKEVLHGVKAATDANTTATRDMPHQMEMIIKALK